jgi:hypothetical protein
LDPTPEAKFGEFVMLRFRSERVLFGNIAFGLIIIRNNFLSLAEDSEFQGFL